MTWNIDSGRINEIDTPFHNLFPEWKIENRLNFIFKEIKLINPDILHLQEARKNNEIDSLTPMLEFLKSQGYNTIISEYGEMINVGFNFITAFKTNFVPIKSINFHYNPLIGNYYIPLLLVELYDTLIILIL